MTALPDGPDRWDPAGVDVGTAAMVRVQIESHITLPAFIAEACQFDQVTEGGKEEWRRVFLAGLDAYHASASEAGTTDRAVELLAAYREGYAFGVAETQGTTWGDVEEMFDEYMRRRHSEET